MEPALTHHITTQPCPICGEQQLDVETGSTAVKPKFDPAQLPDDALISTEDASAWTDHARRSYEKWRTEGRGPPFIKCETSIRYRVGDVRSWLAACRSARTPFSGAK